MADTVRYLMEEMLPELEDMRRKRYFSKEELKEVVRRRQDFEYQLKRKAALKDDFLRYIAYETQLEELRKQRRKALKPTGEAAKQTIADYAIVRRVHFIFERAVRKFKRDLSLWSAWLQFCRATRSYRRLSRVAARALQLHPMEAGLWMFAASWEFEARGDVPAARSLMQQGLRMCKQSPQLWLEYFNMELMYVQKLRAKRQLLGLWVPEEGGAAAPSSSSTPAGAADSSGKKRKRSGKDAAAAAAAGGQDAGGGAVADAAAEDGEGPEDAAAAGSGVDLSTHEQQEADESEAAVRAVLDGAVAAVVYRNAVKADMDLVNWATQLCSGAQQGEAAGSSSAATAAGGNLQQALAAAVVAGDAPGRLLLQAAVLQVLQQYSFGGAQRLAAEVVQDIRSRFPQLPAAVDFLVQWQHPPTELDATSPPTAQQAVQQYEQLITHLTAAAGSGKPSSAREQSHGQQPWQMPSWQRQLQQAYKTAAGYLQQRLGVLLQQPGGAYVEEASRVGAQLLQLQQRCHSAGAADVELYKQWAEAAEQLHQHKVAIQAARAGTTAHPSSLPLWQLRLRLEAAGSSSSSKKKGQEAPAAASSLQLMELVLEALAGVPAAAGAPLWEQALQLCEQPQQLQQLQEHLLRTLAGQQQGPSTGGLGPVAGQLLEVTWSQQGAAAARALYQQLMKVPAAGGDMFRVMVRLEEQQQEQEGVGTAGKQVARVFEDAVRCYGAQDTDLWLEFVQFDQRQGKRGAGQLYWRAVKALQDPEPFIEQYRQLVN